ncbi:MAG: hypothetical protein Q9225_003296 [Loekoesia sp. 1 TL-2023]
MPQASSPISSVITSPSDPGSRTASPRLNQDIDPLQHKWQSESTGTSETSPSLEEVRGADAPALTSLPPIPSSPQNAPNHGQQHSRSLFGNLKAAKSSNKVHKLEPTIRQVSEDIPRDNAKGGGATLYSLEKSPGSTPDLSLSTLNTSSLDIPGGQNKTDIPQRPVGSSILSDTALVTTSADPANSRKNRPRFAHLLTRTRSIRTDEGGGRRSKPTTPIQTALPEDQDSLPEDDEHRDLKTAPLDMETSRSFRDLMGSAIRNKSADRQPSKKPSTASNLRGRSDGEHRGLAPSSSAIFRDGAGSKLFANIKGTSSKAADGLGRAGKAGKGLFNKMGRSGSSNAKEEAGDAHYVLKIIILPLVEQTRHTRIAKRLEDSRDKTEFWMPALPWRCIDYLNFRGCEEEGLYRVPGSGTKIKSYQERFDREELDINLFDEADLYDINIIGSLFKAWLRDLPSEILPKAVQARVAAAHPNATHVPQMLKDELSNLPPWNYYLLFAITCHLSLLHDHHAKNKMSYSNLCICFQPCIGIDAYCFQFLVCDWRSCWQGCWTEKEYLEQEYRAIEGIQSADYGSQHYDDSDSGTIVVEQSTPQSSASSNGRPHLFSRSRERNPPPPLGALQPATNQPNPSNTRVGHTRSESQLPELQPMMPLSPMGWENPSNRASMNAPPSGA